MNQELEQIEVSIDQAKASIELWQSFEKLKRNPDFIKVFTKGYFEEEALRLVKLKADYSMTDDLKTFHKRQKLIDNAITSVGVLHQYTEDVKRKGQIAEANLEDLEEAKSAVLSEV